MSRKNCKNLISLAAGNLLHKKDELMNAKQF